VAVAEAYIPHRSCGPLVPSFPTLPPLESHLRSTVPPFRFTFQHHVEELFRAMPCCSA
jgi:hypothetical protein